MATSLILLIIVSCIANADFQLPKYNSVHFKTKITTQGQKDSYECWISNDKFRVSSNKAIRIFDGENAYLINKNSKSAKKITNPDKLKEFFDTCKSVFHPISSSMNKELNRKLIGKTKLNKIDCLSYEYKLKIEISPIQIFTMKIQEWRSIKNSLALKAIIKGIGYEKTIENEIIDINKKIDRSLFQLPKGTIIEKVIGAGEIAPDFKLKILKGKEVRLSDYKDKKIVFLNFFATWCEPCMREIPIFVEKYKYYSNKDVEFMSIDVLEIKKDYEKKLLKIKDEFKIKWQILLGTDSGIEKLYQIKEVPTNVIIDKSGKIVFYKSSAIKEEELIKELEKLIK